MENATIIRLRTLLASKSTSVLKLSKMMGIAQSTLNAQITGKNAMPYSTIESILGLFPDISAEWLVRGEGEMLRASITNTFQTNYGDRAVQVGGSNNGSITTGDSAEITSLRQQLAEAREEIKKKDECIYKLINSKL